MKKLGITITAIVTVLFLSCTLSQARPGMKHGGPMMGTGLGPMWWNNPQISEQLQLSKEQETKLSELFQANHPAMIDHRGTVEKSLFAFENTMNSNFSENKAKKELGKFLEARNNMLKARMTNLIATRKILSAEQFKTLRSLKHMRRGGRGMKGKGDRQGAGRLNK